MSSQLYFNQYESPNIVIVPNMVVSDPPAKRRRIENNILVPIVDNATDAISKPIQEEPQASSSSANKEVEKKSNITTPSTKKASWASNYLQSIGMTPQSTKSIWQHRIPRKTGSQKSDKTTVSDTSINKTDKCEGLGKPNNAPVDTNKKLQSYDIKSKIKSEKDSVTKKSMATKNSKKNDSTSCNKNKNLITVPKKINVDHMKNNNITQQPTNNCKKLKSIVSSYNNSLYTKSKNEINKKLNKDQTSKKSSLQSDERIDIDKVTKKFGIDNLKKSLTANKIKTNKKLNTKITFKKDESRKDSKANPSKGTTYNSSSNKHKKISKSPIKKQATKTYKKIKVVINVICHEQNLQSFNKEGIDNNKTSASSNIDLDFLNDINIDEIVESLDSCNQEIHNGLNEVPFKTDEVHKGDSYIPLGLFDNTQTDAMDLIKILKGEEDDDLIRQSVENQNDLLFGNNIQQKNPQGGNYNALNNFEKQQTSKMVGDAVEIPIKIKEENERLDMFTETKQSMSAREIRNLHNYKKRKSTCSKNNSQSKSITKQDTLTSNPSNVNLVNGIPLPKDEHAETTGRNTKIYYNSNTCLQLENILKTSSSIIKDKSTNETILFKSGTLDESKHNKNDNLSSSRKAPESAKVINKEENEQIDKQHVEEKISDKDSKLEENKDKENKKCRSDNIQVSNKLHNEDLADFQLKQEKDDDRKNKSDISYKQGQNKYKKQENYIWTSNNLVMNSIKNNFCCENEIEEYVKCGDEDKGVSQVKESNKNVKTKAIAISQKLDAERVTHNLKSLETVRSDTDLKLSTDKNGETSEGNNQNSLLHMTVINDTTPDETNHANTQQTRNENQEKTNCLDNDKCFNKENKNENSVKENVNNSNQKVLCKESKSKTIPLNKDSTTDSKAKFLSLNDDQMFMQKLISNVDAKVTQELEGNMSKCLGLPYSITSLIHNGKFSKIFSCKQGSEKNYALKIITNPKHGMDGNKKQMWNSLQHYIPRKNLFTVYLINAFKCEEKWYILMEYYPKNLAQVLKDAEKSFCIERIQDYARQLVTAVVFLKNNNMVHLDIKPGHILINSSNTILKLCGFDNLCYVSKVTVLPNVGTASYRAPEVILGYPAGFEIDVWSTGVVLFEMAANKKLFPGTYNNDILYKQICTVGYVPYDMINKSRYAQYHYIGTKFMRRLGPCGKDINLIKSFPRNRKLCDTIYNTYFQSWGHQRTKTQRVRDMEKLNTLVTLLQKMLVIHPRHRLSIEFVYGNQFIYDAYKFYEW